MTETTDRQYISALDETNLAFCSLLMCSLASAVARAGTKATPEHFRRTNVPPRFLSVYRVFLEACKYVAIPKHHVGIYLHKHADRAGWPLLRDITAAEQAEARRIAKAVKGIK